MKGDIRTLSRKIPQSPNQSQPTTRFCTLTFEGPATRKPGAFSSAASAEAAGERGDRWLVPQLLAALVLSSAAQGATDAPAMCLAFGQPMGFEQGYEPPKIRKAFGRGAESHHHEPPPKVRKAFGRGAENHHPKLEKLLAGEQKATTMNHHPKLEKLLAGEQKATTMNHHPKLEKPLAGADFASEVHDGGPGQGARLGSRIGGSPDRIPQQLVPLSATFLVGRVPLVK